MARAVRELLQREASVPSSRDAYPLLPGQYCSILTFIPQLEQFVRFGPPVVDTAPLAQHSSSSSSASMPFGASGPPGITPNKAAAVAQAAMVSAAALLRTGAGGVGNGSAAAAAAAAAAMAGGRMAGAPSHASPHGGVLVPLPPLSTRPGSVQPSPKTTSAASAAAPGAWGAAGFSGAAGVGQPRPMNAPSPSPLLQAQQAQQQQGAARGGAPPRPSPPSPLPSPPFHAMDGNDPLSRVDLAMVIAVEEKRLLLELLEKVIKCKAADLFYEPVTEEEAPGYFDVITNPMDLRTLKGLIEGGGVRSIAGFREKVELIASNCKTFNVEGVRGAMAWHTSPWR
jgi:hypothetical protein